ncbi:MAG: GtrA family protein [Clostridia bacterium]|nr:GtrA family protein [Clostridia bacterium]
MKKIKELIIKYKELITYVVFGGLTTVVNLVVFKLSGLALGDERYLISNVIAWIAAVIFAYVTNKIWVFESKSWAPRVLLKEVPSFFAARVFSFLIEEAGLFVFVDLLGFNEYSLNILSFEIGGEMIAKVILAVVVVILNYIFSKLFIFKKKNK